MSGSAPAGYQHNLLAHCKHAKQHARFGRIEFAISCDMTPEFKQAVHEEGEWHPLVDAQRCVTGQDAELCFVPDKSVATRKGEPYRYLAISERMHRPHLPGMLPFQTIIFAITRYRLFDIVTNMDWEGERLIRWHLIRCGEVVDLGRKIYLPY